MFVIEESVLNTQEDVEELSVVIALELERQRRIRR